MEYVEVDERGFGWAFDGGYAACGRLCDDLGAWGALAKIYELIGLWLFTLLGEESGVKDALNHDELGVIIWY